MLRKVLFVLIALLLVGGIIGYKGYNKIFKPNVSTEQANYTIRIPTGGTMVNLVDSLSAQNALVDLQSFNQVARWMSLTDDNLKSGQYRFKSGMSNRTIINALKAGNQHPVNLVVNNVRLLPQLAGKLSLQLEADSLAILDAIKNPVILEKFELQPEALMSLFIPNTYQVWWNTSPNDLVDRLILEQDKWWQKDGRQESIDKLGLTRSEAYTLASIVDKESNLAAEKPRIAGVYLNRLRSGIPLQADPTVVFATGEYDLRRVLNQHLEIDSPYNTYKYPGLPPGPIYMASIAGLEAVIHPESHDYIYFCAAPGGGGHLFAKTLAQHNANARRFHDWLNSQGIK